MTQRLLTIVDEFLGVLEEWLAHRHRRQTERAEKAAVLAKQLRIGEDR